MLRRYQWGSLFLLNLNIIHIRSYWLCWKAQEKFQVESRFCKTIGCIYVTLLKTYLAKKAIFKVSNRNTRKICLLISKITLKTSEPCHQFAIKSLLSVLLSSLTAYSFNNCKPIYVILWDIITKIFDSWKFKMSKFKIFLFLKKQPLKQTNFSIFYLIFKGPLFQHHDVGHLNFLCYTTSWNEVLKFELKKDIFSINFLIKISWKAL